MMAFLDLINASTAWLLGLNPGIGYSIMGMLLAILLGAAGFAAARLRLSPLWALLLLAPYANVVVIWILAYCRWPDDNNSHDISAR